MHLPDTMRAGIRKQHKGAFILDEAKLRKITNVFETYAGKLVRKNAVLFEVQRENDSFYETSSVNVVLSDDNALGRAITSIIVRIRVSDDEQTDPLSIDAETVARLIFGTDPEMGFFLQGPEVSYQIVEKERDWCFLFADELDTQIARVITRHRSFRIANLLDSILPMLPIAIGFYWMLLRPIGSVKRLTTNQIASMSVDQKINAILELANNRPSISSASMGLFLISIVVAFIVGEIKPMRHLWKRLYQPVFYWGDMVQLYDTAQRRLTNFKWGIIVAFVVSIIASFVYGWLSQN